MTIIVEEDEKELDAVWNKHFGKEANKPGGKPDENTSKDTLEKKDEPKPDDKPKEEPKPKEDQPGDKPKEEPKPKEDQPGDKPKEEPKPEDFKHKYEVLQGKYNAEVPGLAFQLAELNKETERLRKENEELKKPKLEPEKEEPKVENPAIKKLKEEYPEIYEGMNALKQEIISEHIRTSKVDELEKKVSKIEEGVGSVKKDMAVSDRDRYLAKMDADPEIGGIWRKYNEDPKFVASLEEIEPLSGRKKGALLKEAWNEMDHVRTANFFKAFHVLNGSKKPGPNPEDGKKEDVHPPRGQKGEDGKKEDAVPVTVQDLRNFERDVQQGKWKGKEAEMEKEHDRLLIALNKARKT